MPQPPLRKMSSVKGILRSTERPYGWVSRNAGGFSFRDKLTAVDTFIRVFLPSVNLGDAGSLVIRFTGNAFGESGELCVRMFGELEG